MIEQPWLQRLQRRLLRFEKVRLRLAALLALARVAVIRIFGDGNVITAVAQLQRQRVRIKTRRLIINVVLQVIGIAAFLGQAQQDDRLADEDAALGLLGRDAVIDDQVAVMQRLHLLREDAPTVFRADGEQTLPHILAEAALPQFQGPVTRQRSITPADGLLHGGGHLAEVVMTNRAQLHGVGGKEVWEVHEWRPRHRDFGIPSVCITK